ncbi:glycosyltransferase [uncultured Sunxiuqinia sp.]|uniref:glycosyltransferase family 2 protein n=1 Tax=uncultured Sunxiuqinia sp. TaxID=1573825 RepID=UPI002AA83CA2|nr:glycosyltransferase [uncultured Sunxiuqinia sp.]
MKQSFKISVIIPLYNKENAVLATIESVLKQEYRNFECLIVDDGSTDNSLSVISQINDDRVKIFTKKNGGVSDARNYGIKYASTNNIFFLDADDIITPGCLRSFMQQMTKYPDAEIYTANFFIERDNKLLTFCSGLQAGYIDNPLKALYYRQIFPRTGTTLIRKYCLIQSGGFDPEVAVHEDSELFIRLIKKYRVVYSPEKIFSYKTGFNEMSLNNISMHKEYAYHIDLRGRSFYERMLLSELIFKAYRRYWPRNRKMAMTFIKKNLRHLPSIIYTVLHIKLVRNRRLIVC